MNESQLVRALTRLTGIATSRIEASGTSTAIDLKDYVGSVRVDFGAISVAGGTSPTIDLAVQTGATTGAMALISGGAFGQVTSIAQDQTLTFDTRAIDRYLNFAYTLGGTTAAFNLDIGVYGIKNRAT